MAEYLPEGIIISILHRLPAEALLRCTAVCKSWYSLIISPQFIHSHLEFTENKARLLFLRRCIRNYELYDLYSENESLTGLEFPFRSINSFFTIVGSCNGLLCLSDDRVYYTNTIVLWNPCIRKSVLLPKPGPIYSSYGTFVQCLGLGFDPVGNDYKVVRIAYVDCGRGQPQVELFKLSTGVWQDMSFLNLECVIYNRYRQAYVNGATHWVASYMNSYDLIVLFDMIHDVFREMMLPIGLANNDPVRSKDLVAYMDSLALIVWNVSGFCVWIMKEYGVEESWSKHLSIDFLDLGPGFNMRPLWVGRRGEVISVWKDGRLLSYNPDGEGIKDLGVQGSRSEEYRRALHVDSCVKSLVLLEKGPCFCDVVTCGILPTLQTNYDDSCSSSGSDSEHNCGSDYKHRHGRSNVGNRAM